MYEGSLCMCCMSTDDLVELFTSRIVNNVEENYAKMLSSGLNIQVGEADGHDSICECCASKLRDCVAFKRQTFKSMSIISSIQITELANSDDLQVLGLHKCEEEKCYKFEIKTKNDNFEVFEDFEEKIDNTNKGNSKETEFAISDDIEVVDEFEVKKESDNKGCSKEDESKQLPRQKPETTNITQVKLVGRPRKHPKDHVPYQLGKDEKKCQECGQEFPNNITLKIHYNTHFRNHVCRTCDKGFVLKTSLAKHETIHLVGPFPCDTCGKVFRSVNTMHSHKRYKHGKVAPYRCRECGAGYKTLQRRRAHEAAAGHARPDHRYACRYCGKSFRYSGDRWKHIANKHEVKYVACPLCGVTFRRGGLRAHMLRRHDVGQGFECTVCQAMHATRSALSVHTQTHLHDRRFICRLCSKAFVQKSALKTHIGSHRRRGEYSGDAEHLIFYKKDADDKNNGILEDNVDVDVYKDLEADVDLELDLDLNLLTEQLDLENLEGLLLDDFGLDVPSELDLT